QEYLAARWFVGRGADGVPELIGLAKDDRHAEVLRLTVAILAADQRAEADERILRVIHSVSDSNPALAAACLLESPRTKLDEEVAERLANAVYSECSTAQRH